MDRFDIIIVFLVGALVGALCLIAIAYLAA
jgi:hypothetical protein